MSLGSSVSSAVAVAGGSGSGSMSAAATGSSSSRSGSCTSQTSASAGATAYASWTLLPPAPTASRHLLELGSRRVSKVGEEGREGLPEAALALERLAEELLGDVGLGHRGLAEPLLRGLLARPHPPDLVLHALGGDRSQE